MSDSLNLDSVLGRYEYPHFRVGDFARAKFCKSGSSRSAAARLWRFFRYDLDRWRCANVCDSRAERKSGIAGSCEVCGRNCRCNGHAPSRGRGGSLVHNRCRSSRIPRRSRSRVIARGRYTRRRSTTGYDRAWTGYVVDRQGRCERSTSGHRSRSPLASSDVSFTLESPTYLPQDLVSGQYRPRVFDAIGYDLTSGPLARVAMGSDPHATERFRAVVRKGPSGHKFFV